ALSSVAISKNNTISEEDAQLAGKDALVQAQKERISEQETRLAKKNTEPFDKQEQSSLKKRSI
ncbi:hypothetical protein, partial [Wolbachia endosymbiont of Wuchereria bancrofti]|uniref:hypothetical protein n=1 Tax=Wolbachia endosymbiont of Wuchereria bancrofti TaxID=96496 RepID=UPI0015D03382